jgi:chromate transporter
LFTFGGGYAMLPLLEREAIDRHGWATHDEILDIYGLAQVVPGVIAVNTATFLGQRQAGYAGAVAATAGMITPSILVILAVAALLGQVQTHPAVVAAFAGVRAGVGGLIVATAWRIVRNACKDAVSIGLMLAGATIALTIRGGAVWTILAALAVGAARYRLERSRNPEGHGGVRKEGAP